MARIGLSWERVLLRLSKTLMQVDTLLAHFVPKPQAAKPQQFTYKQKLKIL